MLADQLVRRGVTCASSIAMPGRRARRERSASRRARSKSIEARDRRPRARARQDGDRRQYVGQGAAHGAHSAGRCGRDITPFPYILILGQDDNERIMGEKLRELGGAVNGTPSLSA